MMRRTWLLMAQHVPASGRGGGIVRYTVEFARAMCRRSDVALTVLGHPGAEEFWTQLLAGGGVVRIDRQPVEHLGPLAQRWGVGSAAYREPVDVVHGVKHLLPRRVAGRSVLTVHDFLPLDRPRDFGLLKRELLPGPYLRSVAAADVTLCVSAATQARLAAYVPEALPHSAVVPLTGAGPTATPEPVSALAGRRFALVVGDASARKNLPLVTRNWSQVRERQSDAVLAVVGPPAWGDEHRGTTDDGVLHLGHVSDGELDWCYRHARMTLCPSMLEGFGLPAAEALHRGVPVITSEDPALCEVTGSAARHVHCLDVAGWIEAILDGFAGGLPVGRRDVRTWDDVVEESVTAVFS